MRQASRSTHSRGCGINCQGTAAAPWEKSKKGKGMEGQEGVTGMKDEIATKRGQTGGTRYCASTRKGMHRAQGMLTSDGDGCKTAGEFWLKHHLPYPKVDR